MHSRTRLIGAVLLTGLLLSGCGADAQDAGSTSAGQPAMAPGEGVAADSAERAGPRAGADKAAPAQAKAQAPNLSVDQRSIVYRGNITVRVQDVTAKAGEAIGIATTAGGFVGDDQRQQGRGDGGNATLTLRVPADKFAGVVDQLSRLGEEQNRGISTEDVTEQTVDLDARITVQQARVESGRRLLAQAKSLTDLVMLEREVATRESDLASLQGKKRRLADLTALSTITVSLVGPDAKVDVEEDDDSGFLSGLAGGWRALVSSLGVLFTVLGALLPWALVLGLPIWAVFWLLRRRGRPAAPAFAAAGPVLPGHQPPVSLREPAKTETAATGKAATDPAGRDDDDSEGAGGQGR